MRMGKYKPVNSETIQVTRNTGALEKLEKMRVTALRCRGKINRNIIKYLEEEKTERTQKRILK